MNLSRALAADLRELAVDLSANACTRETLAVLQRDLHHQVPSALGAIITLTLGDVPGCPIGINLLRRPIEPVEIAAALLIPLDVFDVAVTGRVVFYASSATAFIELVDTLAAAMHVEPAFFDQDPDLPQSRVEPGVTGLEDLSVVNRAVGVLINRGRSPSAARAELRRRADRSRSDLPTAARAVLDTMILEQRLPSE